MQPFEILHYTSSRLGNRLGPRSPFDKVVVFLVGAKVHGSHRMHYAAISVAILRRHQVREARLRCWTRVGNRCIVSSTGHMSEDCNAQLVQLSLGQLML